MSMKKYFFVAFNAMDGYRSIGFGGLIVVCSCSFERIGHAILNYYNECVNEEYKADNVCITTLTVLDKQTAAQLSENFSDGALIIEDGEKEEEKAEEVKLMWLARDKNNRIYLFEKKPEKDDEYWSYDDGDYMELDVSSFPEVQWSDSEPTKVKIVIEK